MVSCWCSSFRMPVVACSACCTGSRCVPEARSRSRAPRSDDLLMNRQIEIQSRGDPISLVRPVSLLSYQSPQKSRSRSPDCTSYFSKSKDAPSRFALWSCRRLVATTRVASSRVPGASALVRRRLVCRRLSIRRERLGLIEPGRAWPLRVGVQGRRRRAAKRRRSWATGTRLPWLLLPRCAPRQDVRRGGGSVHIGRRGRATRWV